MRLVNDQAPASGTSTSSASFVVRGARNHARDRVSVAVGLADDLEAALAVERDVAVSRGLEVAGDPRFVGA